MGMGLHINMKHIFVFCILISVSACSEKITATAVPTTAKDIQHAQNEAFGAFDPLTIQQGEFVYMIHTQEVFSSQEPVEALISEESLNIVERVDHVDYVEFTLVKEVIDHQQTDSPHFKFKDVLYVARPVEESNETPTLVKKEDTPEENTSPASVAFYNLLIKKETVRKLAKVIEHEPCNEADGSCNISVTKITYDVYFTNPPEQPQITSVEMWISQEVPYMAAVLKNCFKAVISIGEARPAIRQCTTVLDYRYK
jgi:hypothetical protein